MPRIKVFKVYKIVKDLFVLLYLISFYGIFNSFLIRLVANMKKKITMCYLGVNYISRDID